IRNLRPSRQYPQSDGGEKTKQRWAHATDQFFVERNEADAADRVRLRVLLPQAVRNRVNIGLSPAQGHARPEPPDNTKVEGGSLCEDVIAGGGRKVGHDPPGIGPEIDVRFFEVGGHSADYRPVLAVQEKSASEDPRVFVEAPFPEPVA